MPYTFRQRMVAPLLRRTEAMFNIYKRLTNAYLSARYAVLNFLMPATTRNSRRLVNQQTVIHCELSFLRFWATVFLGVGFSPYPRL